MGRINEPAVHQVVKNTIRFSCPVVKQCGGCQFEDPDYGAQLAAKQKRVERLLGSFCQVEPIMGMENPFYYRNKIHAAFDTDRKGNVISGVYAEGTHRVIPVKECLLENQCADKIIGTIKRLLVSFRLKAYDEDRKTGFLRHVLIRTGHTTGDIMVVLVAGTPVFPSKNNFVKALRREHPEITTIVLNINSRKTSMVLGEREQVLYGRGFILDTLCGMQFAISPKSFYQINPVQTEVLYRTAISMADLTGSERILDAYCGIGTIGLLASRQAKEVLGVEVNQDAVRNAISNAKQNGVKNVRFFEKDAGLFMRKLAAEGRKVDVVFLDPPRAGSDEMFLNSMAVLRPERVVYISCNPETLARDLKYLTGRGYGVMRAVPVDMFPGTGHVETVVMLSHKKPDSVINVKVEFGEGEGKVPLDNIAKRAEAYKPKERITYKMIKEYIEAKYGFKVHTAYIAEVKRELGLPIYDAPNAVEELKRPRKHPTVEKVEAIKDAFKYYNVL